MIVKITFDDNSVMLFGNSYKPWTMQFDEYCRILRRNLIKNEAIKFESCNANWVSWGGLKWCSEDEFQSQLNREGSQYDEPDNPSLRKYSKMKFVENNFVKNKALKILKS